MSKKRDYSKQINDLERRAVRRAQASIRKIPGYFRGDGFDWEARLAQAEVGSGGWYYGKTWLTGQEVRDAEKRWALRAYRDEVKDKNDWIPNQCGGCKFFAALGSDFGICWNKNSPLDGCISFEHGGCEWHSDLKGEEQ